MHPIIYPNNVSGDSALLAKYILNVCKKHRDENRALAFAFIISDLENPHVNKILRDSDYVNAIHSISGNTLTVFFLNDHFVNTSIHRANENSISRLEFGVEPVNASPNLSPKALATILTNDSILTTPSILFFQVEEITLTNYFVTTLRENKIEDGFLEIKSIIGTAVDSLGKVQLENRQNSKELFTLLKQGIDSSEYWKSARRNYEKAMKIKDFFSIW